MDYLVQTRRPRRLKDNGNPCLQAAVGQNGKAECTGRTSGALRKDRFKKKIASNPELTPNLRSVMASIWPKSSGTWLMLLVVQHRVQVHHWIAGMTNAARKATSKLFNLCNSFQILGSREGMGSYRTMLLRRHIGQESRLVYSKRCRSAGCRSSWEGSHLPTSIFVNCSHSLPWPRFHFNLTRVKHHPLLEFAISPSNFLTTIGKIHTNSSDVSSVEADVLDEKKKEKLKDSTSLPARQQAQPKNLSYTL